MPGESTESNWEPSSRLRDLAKAKGVEIPGVDLTKPAPEPFKSEPAKEAADKQAVVENVPVSPENSIQLHETPEQGMSATNIPVEQSTPNLENEVVEGEFVELNDEPTIHVEESGRGGEERRSQPQGQEQGDKQKNKPMTEDELNEKLEHISHVKDQAFKAKALNDLASSLFHRGQYDFSEKVSDMKAELDAQFKVQNIEGLPEDRSDTGMRRWARQRMARLLDPNDDVNSRQEVFSVVFTDPRTQIKNNQDGSLQLSKELYEDIIAGKIGDDGRAERKSEYQVAQEVGKLYSDWRKAHRKIDTLVTAFDNEYKLPDNKLNKRLLNGLESEDGRDREGGSKNIAEALRIYWAMAHSKEEEGREILESYGLEGIKNLFFDSLSNDEIGEIRGEIARRCGGRFYENIGMMYASFFGVAAYGSKSGPYADAMGGLIHTENNRFLDANGKVDQNIRYDASKRGSRYLDDSVANAMYVVNNGRKLMINGKDVPVEIGVHSGNLQTKVESPEPRAFYIIRQRGTRGEKYIAVKELKGTEYARDPNAKNLELDTSRFEEVLFDDLIKEGRINEINWGDSMVDISSMVVSREKAAVNVYKLFKNLDDDFGKLNAAGLVAKKDIFKSALPQYGKETQQYMAYLWLFSLINKNGNSWTVDKKNDLVKMLDMAVTQGVISGDQKGKLFGEYYLGALGDGKQFFDGTINLVSVFKSAFGKLEPPTHMLK